MLKRLIILCLLLSTPVVAQAKSETSGSLGGILINDDDITITGSIKHITDKKPTEYFFEADAIYRTGNERTQRQQVNAFTKLNQDIHKSHYIQTAVRYRHDTRSRFQNQAVYTVGHGYRILRTDKTRISNEISAGYKHGTNELSEFIVRDSVWLSHNLSKTTSVTNKFLIEQGQRTFIQNRFELKFKIGENTSVSIQDIYTKDDREDNTFSFAFGIKF
jgi:putative salt-induced outer membrane protein YdiY